MRALAVALLVVLAPMGSVRAQDVAAVYRARCATCHGEDGKKKGDLIAASASAEVAGLARRIASGNSEKKMPAFKGKLSDAEILAMAEYLQAGLK
jgi:mono/diheme cytochrome c family protein